MIKYKIQRKLNNFQKKSSEIFFGSVTNKFDEISKCNICKNSKFEIICDKERHGFEMKTQICENCGYMFTNPFFSDEFYKKLYNSNFRNIYSRNVRNPDENFFKLERYRGLEIINLLSKKISLDQIHRSLDVGCGSGASADVFSDYFTLVEAIDYDSEYFKLNRNKKNIFFSERSIFDSYFDNKKYDFINYCHVFEHLKKPVKELKRIKEILSNKGYLYIEVPGIYSVDKWYDGNFFHSLHIAHTQHFTLNTLKNMMLQNGFKLIYGNEVIRSIWTHNNNENNFSIKNEYFFIKNKIKSYDRIHRIILMSYSKKLLRKLKSTIVKILKIIGLYKITKRIYFRLSSKKILEENL